MCCDREGDNAPTLVRKHEENVEDLKPDRRHGEEVYGHKRFHMVVKEDPPGLRRWLPTAYQVFAHARFTNIDAELQQLAVYTRCAPTRILVAHAADQIANFARDHRAARLTPPDLPRPEKAKRLALPTNHCLGLHDDQRRAPIRPGAGEPNPQEPV